MMLESRVSTSEEELKTGLKFRVSLFDSPESIKRVVYLVHGRAGDLNSMWIFAKRSESWHEGETLFIAPQAPLSDPLRGWSWWHVGQRSGGSASKEELQQAKDNLHGFILKIEQMLGVQNIEERFVAGFSQGSGTSVSLSFEQPELFKGVGILAGFIPKAEQEITASLRDERVKMVRYFMAAGLKDEIIDIEQSRKGRDYINSLGAELTYREDEVGHKISSQGIRSLREWLGKE